MIGLFGPSAVKSVMEVSKSAPVNKSQHKMEELHVLILPAKSEIVTPMLALEIACGTSGLAGHLVP